MIRKVQLKDAIRIAEIYNHYIEHTIITFEEELITPKIIEERIQEIIPKFPYLVYEKDGVVVGYAYAALWKSRCSYFKSVETSIYLDENVKGKGMGKKLYGELINILKQSNDRFHVAIGGVSLPNEASVALHEKLGFEKIAHFKEVGYKFDKYIDVGYWELIL